MVFTMFFCLTIFMNTNNSKGNAVEIEDSTSTVFKSDDKVEESFLQTMSGDLYSRERSYQSYLDLPYNDLIFSDNKVFETLKNLYNDIQFSDEFKKGNLNEYDYYKTKFLELLNNERKFTNKNTGDEIFLDEYDYLETYSTLEDWDSNKYEYIFFDMDEDGVPELGIVSFGFRTDIFKYIPNKDEIILWTNLFPSYYQLNGSLKVRYNREGTSHVFYYQTKEGELEEKVSFLIKDTFNKKNNCEETIYLVSFPKHLNYDLSELYMIKRQAYYVEGSDNYCFRVTEQQFIELTKDYFEAEKLASEKIKEVTYTYDRLFGSL
jgi:hypothetical protein